MMPVIEMPIIEMINVAIVGMINVAIVGMINVAIGGMIKVAIEGMIAGQIAMLKVQVQALNIKGLKATLDRVTGMTSDNRAAALNGVAALDAMMIVLDV